MSFALIKNNNIIIYPYDLIMFKNNNPNVSLPEDPSEEQLNNVGIYTINLTSKPFYNPIYKNCYEDSPEIVNGVWYQKWTISDATSDEIAYRETLAKQENKLKAMSLLQETDWTQISDVNLENKQDFSEYRSNLRAIAINPPVEVLNWPTIPEEVWANV